AEDDVYATKSAEELVLPEALEELLDLKDQGLTEDKAKGWIKPDEKNTSLDLDIYDDLDEMKPRGSTKTGEKDTSLDLDIYDDLDDFQEAEDHKTKELLAWEAKYEKAQAEIQALKSENKALGKKIKTMEVTLQSLLDTAKAEVKRKEALIAQLRKEKDDLCFRRKRGREVEEPGERGHESKRLKESQPRVFAKKDPETERNPFKTVPKDDTKNATSKDDVKRASTKDDVRKAGTKDDARKAGTKEDAKKTVSRSKSPKLGQPKTTERRSSTHSRRPENRHKSRDRRHSRSRSPRHSTRRDEPRSRESNARQVKRRSRSQSPRIHLPAEKSHTMTTLFGDESNDPRSESPHLEMAKTTTELQPSKKVVSKPSDVTSEIKTNSPFDPKEHPKDTSPPTGGFFSEVCKPKEAIIPGLDIITKAESLDFVSDQIEVVKKATKPVENINFHIQNSAHDELKKASIPLDSKMPQVDGKIQKILSKHSTKELRTAISEQEQEPQVNLEKKTSLAVEAIDVKTANIEERMDQVLLPAAATAPTETDFQFSASAKTCSGKDIQKPTDEPSRMNKSLAGIRIIEDIRLPKMADIDHIAVKVDNQCKAPTAITNSASNDQLVDETPQDRNPRLDELKDTKCTSYKDDTPIKSATVLYAKPDSTKLDHNDENDEVILEAAMNLLTSEQDPSSIVDPSYPNLSIEEDAIEMALEQLHQQSPDETVVTSTSNRAQQTPKQNLITILTQSPVHQSPLKSKTKSKKTSPMATPEEPATEKTPLKKRKVNMDSPTQVQPVSRLELSVENTSGTSLGGGDTSTVTKRCSLGHTDYQYEQIKDEVILRVKRRCRRRRPAPVELQTVDGNQAI
ncbi:hypothetical protein KR084_013080, partial [Drosophila pseudotakahashii]